jgi:2-amino-4-hydroxy-6-hydroxymethyldihydropteridine diphosphokinase
MGLCLIAVGANEGDRRANLSRAASALAERSGFVMRAQSTWHETQAVGGPEGQPSYLNGAVIVETSLSPTQVLAALAEIEASLGRERKMRWGPRTIDLDLLLYDDVRLDSPELTLPHPRMAFRKFVLEPAAEIAPDWRHPTIGWTLLELRDHVRYATPYVAVTGPPGAGKSVFAAQLAARLGARLVTDTLDLRIAASTDADSAGRARAGEIKFITRRREMLDPQGWGSQPRLTISDFWLEQSRAYISTWTDTEARREISALIDAASATVVRPKLLVLLDPPRATNVGAADENERIRRALVAAAERSGVGPLLRLGGGGLTAQIDEATAAIAAMS